MKSIKLLYSSCEAYRELHSGFFLFFRKYFPEFSGEILSSLSGDFHSNGFFVKGIPDYAKDLDFSSRLLIAIDALSDEELLFFTLDDFFFDSKADMGRICAAISLMNEDSTIGFINLWDCVESSGFIIDPQGFFCEYPRRKPFSASTQFGLWRVRYLRKLLRKGESAWDFERFGTIRSWHYKERILRCYQIRAVHYVEGGVINEGALRSASRGMLLAEDALKYVSSFDRTKSKKAFSFWYKLKYLVIYPFRKSYLQLYLFISIRCYGVKFLSSFYNQRGNPFK